MSLFSQYYCGVFSAYTQTVTIKFFDSDKAIPYVNVYDTLSRTNYGANPTGVLVLSAKSYFLTTSHVSYFPKH